MIKQHQSGSAHVIIVIILVVALAGALGFIFWQNVLNKSEDSKPTAKTQTDKNATSNSSANKKTSEGLVISGWNISIPATGELSYAMQDTDHATIYSPELTKAEKDAGCNEANGVSVYRTDSLDNIEPSLQSSAKKVGAYYYGIMHSSQALCVGQGSAKGTDQGDASVNAAYERLFTRVVSAVWYDLAKA